MEHNWQGYILSAGLECKRENEKNTAGGVTLRGFGWECDGVPPIIPVVSPI